MQACEHTKKLPSLSMCKNTISMREIMLFITLSPYYLGINLSFFYIILPFHYTTYSFLFLCTLMATYKYIFTDKSLSLSSYCNPLVVDTSLLFILIIIIFLANILYNELLFHFLLLFFFPLLCSDWWYIHYMGHVPHYSASKKTHKPRFGVW